MNSLPSNMKNQKGITLIVVLIILVVMTFLGLSAISDTNIQLAMVRNSQLQDVSHNASLSEINAQRWLINSNAPGDLDESIVVLIQSPLNADGISKTVESGANTFEILLDDAIGQERYESLYESRAVLHQPDSENTQPVGGFSLSGDASIKNLIIEIQSEVTVKNSGTVSSQIEGFTYLSAN